MSVPHKDTSNYGIVDLDGEVSKDLYKVNHFVEKPTPEEAPSDLANIGRYFLTPELFDSLKKKKPFAGNEEVKDD